MIKKAAIVSGFLVGSALAAWGASSTLSGLSPGTAISGTDLFYDVQTAGVGGVKVTGTQFLSWVFGNVSGNCTSSISGVFSCTGGNATGIGAGTNITTSGTGTNVTVNTTLTPTFTSITTTLASVTGWLTAAGVNMQTATIAGALVGSSANFSGAFVGTTGNFSSNLTGQIGQFPGFLTASGANFNTVTIVNNLTGNSASFSTSLTVGTLQATGFLTASGGSFTTLTVTGLTPTGPNCLQETGGLLQASGTACAGSSTNIAAGTNITTSGTVSNVTVNTTLTPTFTSITTTLASVTGWLTAAGVNMQTATVAGAFNGSTANLTGNLTGTTAAFSGSLTAQGAQFPGFLTATGANFGTTTITSLGVGTQCVESVNGIITGTGSTCAGISIVAGTNIATSGTANNITVSTTLTPTFTNLTATNAGSIAALTGSSINFVSGTITTLTSTNGWITSLTSTNGSITTLTGGSATFQTVTVKSLTPTGPNCLQETGGVLQATNAACGSGSGTPATGGPILPSSEYLGGASGLLFPTFYVPSTNTIANQGALEGIGLVASLVTSATAVLQFNMPEVIPTANMRLRLLYMANATTGNVTTWIQDALTSASSSLGVATLTSETTKTIAITTADVLIEKKFALTQTPTAGSNQILTVLLNLTGTVAQTVVIQPSIIWE